MFKEMKIYNIILLVILTLAFIPNFSYGNSAEPPSVLIIVPNAPTDLEISLRVGDHIIQGREINKIIETHYTFYNSQISANFGHRDIDYLFTICTGETDYEIALGKVPTAYNNIYTLDLDAQVLTPGKLPSRSILLVAIRIMLTLAIEGIIFWRFGFKNKESWLAFFIINLATQGVLNIWINGFTPTRSYMIFSLIFAEIIILITEMLSFSAFVKEQSKSKRVAYVFVANILSFIAGGYVITVLPV